LCLKLPHLIERLLSRMPFWNSLQDTFLSYTVRFLSTDIEDAIKNRAVDSFQLVVGHIHGSHFSNTVWRWPWNEHLKQIARIVVRNNPHNL
jgi:hypothetical protein